MNDPWPIYDRLGNQIRKGDEVLYRGVVGNAQTTPGIVIGERSVQGKIAVQLNGMRYAIAIKTNYLEKSPNNKKGIAYTESREVIGVHSGPSEGSMALTVKELRAKAREYGIEGWERFSKQELAVAVAAVEGGNSVPKASAAKKEPAKGKKVEAAKPAEKKVATKASTNGTSDNPFRPGSNLHTITEALKQGGSRSQLVEAIRGKVEFNFRNEVTPEYEQGALFSRIALAAKILSQQYNWKVDKEGRGESYTLKATPPKG